MDIAFYSLPSIRRISSGQANVPDRFDPGIIQIQIQLPPLISKWRFPSLTRSVWDGCALILMSEGPSQIRPATPDLRNAAGHKNTTRPPPQLRRRPHGLPQVDAPRVRSPECAPPPLPSPHPRSPVLAQHDGHAKDPSWCCRRADSRRAACVSTAGTPPLRDARRDSSRVNMIVL